MELTHWRALTDRLERRRELEADPGLRTAQAIVDWTDRLHLDPLVGLLLPGAGDLMGGVLGLYIVGLAIKKRLPPVVIARMLLRLGADTVMGAVPLLGDVGDFFYRANRKNLVLLRERHEIGAATRGDWMLMASAALVFLAALAIPVFLVVWALSKVGL